MTKLDIRVIRLDLKIRCLNRTRSNSNDFMPDQGSYPTQTPGIGLVSSLIWFYPNQ